DQQLTILTSGGIGEASLLRNTACDNLLTQSMAVIGACFEDVKTFRVSRLETAGQLCWQAWNGTRIPREDNRKWMSQSVSQSMSLISRFGLFASPAGLIDQKQ